MRCRDVSREIEAPSGAIVSSDLEAHLAACSSCSQRAEQVARLDRLWEATRPASPSPASWDAAWSRIERELAVPTSGDPSEDGDDRRRRLPIRAGFGLIVAAAAALVIALNLPGRDRAPTVARQAPIRGDLEVNVGQTVLYHVDSGTEEIIQSNELAAAEPGSSAFSIDPALIRDDFFVFFGIAEMLPEQLASTDGHGPFDPLTP